MFKFLITQNAAETEMETKHLLCGSDRFSLLTQKCIYENFELHFRVIWIL